MHIKIASCFIVALGLGGLSAVAPAQTTMPPVIVEARAIPSGNIICYGRACELILQQMMDQAREEQTSQGPIGPDDVAVDRAAFCQTQRAAKPYPCDAGTAPPVPGFNMSEAYFHFFHSRSCSTGMWGNTVQNALTPDLVNNMISVDEPMPYVSFADACRSLDACYAAQVPRQTCDIGFGVQLDAVCGGSGFPATCENYAEGYRAVATVYGADEFTAREQGARCAAWHMDMDANGCPKQ